MNLAAVAARLRQGAQALLRHMWLPALLIFAGKLIAFAVLGVQGETDSYGYLEPRLSLYHPPGYNVLAYTLASTGSLVPLVLVQCLVFAVSGAWMGLQVWEKSRRGQILWAVLLALEPCSSFFCAAVMTESLFLSGAFLCWGLVLRRPEDWRFVALAGLIAGGIWMIRFTGFLLPLSLLPLILFLKAPWRTRARLTALLWLGFLVGTLPLRSLYGLMYGSWNPNSFAGMSLWNATAWLYPDSPERQSPQTDFERWLAQQPDSLFDMSATWYTAQIYGDPLPLNTYLASHELHTRQKLALCAELESAGWARLLRAPGRYLREFVQPNFMRPLRGEMATVNAGYFAPLGADFSFPPFTYSAWPWRIALPVLLLCLPLFLLRRRHLPPHPRRTAALLLVFLFSYLALISLVTVIFLRFVWLCVPLVLLLALQFLPRRGASDPPAD